MLWGWTCAFRSNPVASRGALLLTRLPFHSVPPIISCKRYILVILLSDPVMLCLHFQLLLASSSLTRVLRVWPR